MNYFLKCSQQHAVFNLLPYMKNKCNKIFIFKFKTHRTWKYLHPTSSTELNWQQLGWKACTPLMFPVRQCYEHTWASCARYANSSCIVYHQNSSRQVTSVGFMPRTQNVNKCLRILSKVIMSKLLFSPNMKDCPLLKYVQLRKLKFYKH